MNVSLAFIEGAKPRDEIESALVIQMACTHSATMAVLSRLGGALGGDRLRRRRHGGSQTLRVEHVHVNEGGQAIIGNVKSIPGSGR